MGEALVTRGIPGEYEGEPVDTGIEFHEDAVAEARRQIEDRERDSVTFECPACHNLMSIVPTITSLKVGPALMVVEFLTVNVPHRCEQFRKVTQDG